MLMHPIKVFIAGAKTGSGYQREAAMVKFFPVPLYCTLAFLLFLPAPSARAAFPETLLILQKAYSGELRVHSAYAAFAKKAREEHYPNIAYLFRHFPTPKASMPAIF